MNGTVDPLDPQGKSQGKGDRKHIRTLVVGGGCFWCTEAFFEELVGVVDVESGYANSEVGKPTYEMICTGRTGAAEVIKITFDGYLITERDLLRVFFTTHDPTSLNRQGPDTGTQYRSAIFYHNPTEKAIATASISEITSLGIYKKPIVTTLEPLRNYTRAEEYHQDYFAKYNAAPPAVRATMNAGYCTAIVSPKVAKFRAQYADKLKKPARTKR